MTAAPIETEFTAGDLLMAAVLRILRATDLVTNMPILKAYLARCEARPAFQRALDAQLAAFRDHAPAGIAATIVSGLKHLISE